MNAVWDAVKAKSPDDASRLEGKRFEDQKMDLRQQAPGGDVVGSLDEAFEAALRIRGGFGKLLKYTGFEISMDYLMQVNTKMVPNSPGC